MSNRLIKSADKSTEIYPKHGESLIDEVAKETTSEKIKKIKAQPMGLMAAFRRRRRIGLAKKEADAKRKRDLADGKTLELRQSLIRETELKEELAAAKDGLSVKEGADKERQALDRKGVVEV